MKINILFPGNTLETDQAREFKLTVRWRTTNRITTLKATGVYSNRWCEVWCLLPLCRSHIFQGWVFLCVLLGILLKQNLLSGEFVSLIKLSEVTLISCSSNLQSEPIYYSKRHPQIRYCFIGFAGRCLLLRTWHTFPLFCLGGGEEK